MSQSEIGAVIVGQQVNAVEPTPMLAIIADRRLSLAAMTALLLRDPKWRFLEDARGITQVRERLAVLRPPVLILDSGDAESFSLVDASLWNGRLLLLLDPDDDPAVFVEAVRAQPFGYLSRRASRESLVAAVDSLAAFGFYLDPLLTDQVLCALRTPEVESTASPELTQRERAILVRIASGKSTKEIAREYAITAKTVGNHVNNMYQKLHVHHRGQLVLYAAQQGLATI